MNTTIEKIARIKQLQAELGPLQDEVTLAQRNCQHKFGDTESDPISKPRMEFSHFDEHGSDPNPRYRKTGTDEEPRWKRVCSDCGKVKYTDKLKPTGSEPDFG